jgi:hypothetical protein
MQPDLVATKPQGKLAPDSRSSEWLFVVHERLFIIYCFARLWLETVSALPIQKKSQITNNQITNSQFLPAIQPTEYRQQIFKLFRADA